MPGAWDKRAVQWDWKQRAEAWDQVAVEEERRAAEREERLAQRERRKAVLEEAFVKLETLVENMDGKTSVAQITLLLEAVLRNQRIEYDDEPATRLKWETDDGSPPVFNFILQQVPPRRPDDGHPDDGVDDGDD